MVKGDTMSPERSNELQNVRSWLDIMSAGMTAAEVEAALEQGPLNHLMTEIDVLEADLEDPADDDLIAFEASLSRE